LFGRKCARAGALYSPRLRYAEIEIKHVDIGQQQHVRAKLACKQGTCPILIDNRFAPGASAINENSRAAQARITAAGYLPAAIMSASDWHAFCFLQLCGFAPASD